jgi:hypothetical protein
MANLAAEFPLVCIVSLPGGECTPVDFFDQLIRLMSSN